MAMDRSTGVGGRRNAAPARPKSSIAGKGANVTAAMQQKKRYTCNRFRGGKAPGTR